MKKSTLIGISRHRICTDGEGVTTLVAFHGCPLRCKYCINRQALSADGVWKSMSPQEIFDEVKKDDIYFEATGGGVTFGGGEPLLACQAILHFRKLCVRYGKNWKINIETSLNVPHRFVKTMANIVDHWIVDIKDMNPTIYKAYTGKDNALLLDNLKYLVDNRKKITARVPLISGYNSVDDVEASVRRLTEMGIVDIDRFEYITEPQKLKTSKH